MHYFFHGEVGVFKKRLGNNLKTISYSWSFSLARDLGLLSKLPLRAITSWQNAVHVDVPEYPVFGRDLLEVEVMDEDREGVLFVVFINHLKSHFIPWWIKEEEEKAIERQRSNQRRQRQAEMIKEIVKSESSLNDL